MAYGSSQIRHIGNWSSALSCEVLALIRRISFVGYDYKLRTSIKGQILADFIVECPEDDSLVTTTEAEEELLDPWMLFTDGTSCVDGSGPGLILTNLEGIEFTYALRFSRKELGMIHYLEKVKALANNFKKFSIKQVPRSENKKAGALSKIESTRFAHLTKQVLVEERTEKSIHEAEVLIVVKEEGNTWMTPIYKYLTKETLLTEKEKARVIRRKSRRYAVINKVLYKKSYLGPWLRCIRPLQANYVLREIHEGSCRTTHSNIGVKSCASASALPPSSTHKPMAWWKEQIEAWEKE
ncbi:hypothetical protein Tco_0586286 [Tanacetum coccineum]